MQHSSKMSSPPPQHIIPTTSPAPQERASLRQEQAAGFLSGSLAADQLAKGTKGQLLQEVQQHLAGLGQVGHGAADIIIIAITLCDSTTAIHQSAMWRRRCMHNIDSMLPSTLQRATRAWGGVLLVCVWPTGSLARVVQRIANA